MPRRMKDSGLQWVGKIPAEWSVERVQTVFDEVTVLNLHGMETRALKFYYGTIVSKNNFGIDDEYVARTILNYTLVRPGDIMINGLNLNFDLVSLRVAQVKDSGAITSAYMAIRLKDNVPCTSLYATYLLKAYDYRKAFHNMGKGVRKILSFTEFKKNKILLPPLPEQEAIAAFLDSVTGKIDALRGKLKREIDRLEDYKKSAITKAVCHGLDPKAKMKDSGIPWVGKVPQGWKVNRGKYFLRLLARPTREDDGVITCFRDGEVTLRSNRREEGFTISLKECGYQGIEPGDLVVHGMDGFAGSIGISDSRGKASPVLNVLDTDEDKKYLMYYLRSMAYRDVFTALSTGIRVRSCDLRWKKLADLVYILPPLPEQREIAAHIDAMVWRVNAIIEKRKRQLDALDKLKRTVVYDYVTGKREVPLPKGGRSR